MDIIDNEPRMWWGVEIHEDLAKRLASGGYTDVMAHFVGCFGELEVELERPEDGAWMLRWSLPSGVTRDIPAMTLLGVATSVASRMEAGLRSVAAGIAAQTAMDLVATSPALVVCSLALPGVARERLEEHIGMSPATAAMAAGLTPEQLHGHDGLLHHIAPDGTLHRRAPRVAGVDLDMLLLGGGRMHHLLADYLLGRATHERQLALVCGAVQVFDGLEEDPDQGEESVAELLDRLSAALRVVFQARHSTWSPCIAPPSEDDESLDEDASL